ncbi:hypothetical protein SDC9_165979 [bioreactor metagenome]|uniref:Uncharacterized protein n=1 Tax=bioreactor metagenome TaxID=1076179 RepID=A0A645FVS7_9ZZZZ
MYAILPIIQCLRHQTAAAMPNMELRHVKNLFKNHFIVLYQLISLFSKKIYRSDALILGKAGVNAQKSGMAILLSIVKSALELLSSL